MKILFVHQNFPGQYKHLAPALAALPGTQAMALTMHEAPELPGVAVVRYRPKPGPTKGIHPWVSDVEVKVRRGEAAARAALDLRNQGFVPDIICAHPGWGEALFLKEVFPDAPLLGFFEYYYRPSGGDVGFDPETSIPGFDQLCQVRLRNVGNLLSLEAADWGLSPTEWQRAQFPAHYRSRIGVIHDGIDSARVRPNSNLRVRLGQAGLELTPRDEVITYVARSLEPYRGFHIFMRALPEILRRRKRARVVIVGHDGVSYGAPPPGGGTYKQKMLAELGDALDRSRVHFLGRVPYDRFLGVLQISAVHVYLTYPFVLSWSMLEAMAAGCAVVGSATAPVTEVIDDGVNGLLVDFFDPRGIADAVDRVLDHPDRMAQLRARARQTIVERYDLRSICLPRQIALVQELAAGRRPPVGSAPDIGAAVGR